MPMRYPPDLGDAGRRLFKELTSGFILDPGEHAIATEAARTADALVELAALTEAASGSERRLCMAESRSQRLVLARLVRQLEVKDDPPAPTPARTPRRRLGVDG